MPRAVFKIPRVFFQVVTMPSGQGMVKAMLHTIFCVNFVINTLEMVAEFWNFLPFLVSLEFAFGE